MAINFKYYKDQKLYVEVMVGIVDFEELTEHLKKVEALDLANIVYVYSDFTQVNFRFSDEERQQLIAAFNQVSKNYSIERWAIVASDAHNTITTKKVLRDYEKNLDRRVVKFFDCEEIVQAYAYVGIEGVEERHHQILAELKEGE